MVTILAFRPEDSWSDIGTTKSPYKWINLYFLMLILGGKSLLSRRLCRSCCSYWDFQSSRRVRLPTISLSCRGRWSLTTARSHLPDSPPDFTAWDCSPLLPFAMRAGLGRTWTDLPSWSALLGQSVCLKETKRHGTLYMGEMYQNY